MCVSYGFSDRLEHLTLLEATLLFQTVAAPSFLDEFVREEADVESSTA